MTMGALVSTAMLLMLGGWFSGRRRPRLWLALTVGGTLAWLLAALWVLGTGIAWEFRSGVRLGGEAVHLRLDALSAWFLALLAVVGGGGAIYAVGYWPDREKGASAGRGRQWWNVLVLCMGLVLMCANGLHFLMVWESFALSAYFLITLEKERRETREAGWLYLAASHAGTLGLFAFFSSLASGTGTWELGSFRDRAELAPLFWLALFGFGLKAGMFPLHIWLPSAHANAPSHVSAIMSGVAIKMGLYGLVRFGGWLPLPAGAGWAVLGLGAASGLLGAAGVLAQNDLKRLLAYCSVENMGVMLLGLGVALLDGTPGGAVWSRVAMAGTLLHVWNHGLFKSLLFLGAGSVLHATGTRELSRMGGLWRALPWTAGAFALGAGAASALPPLNGFVSEWLIYLGLVEAWTGHQVVAPVLAAATLALAVTGALTLAGFIKATGLVFLGTPRTRGASEAHEGNAWMRAPMCGLSLACVGMALLPARVWPWLEQPLRVFEPSWAAATPPAPLATVGAWQVALAALAAGAAAALWQRARATGVRRELTWDCGYAAPTARMQYTGGSFAAIAVGWFRWALRPRRQWRRPRGVFPQRATHDEQTPDAVLEHVLQPIGRLLLMASAWVRRRQHGHLPDYILYLGAGLATVGVLVAIWSKP